MNKYSHIDLRVNSWEKVRLFYEHLLPALGFTRTFHSERWKVIDLAARMMALKRFWRLGAFFICEQWLQRQAKFRFTLGNLRINLLKR